MKGISYYRSKEKGSLELACGTISLHSAIAGDFNRKICSTNFTQSHVIVTETDGNDRVIEFLRIF